MVELARTGITIVDPYMDEKMLVDFAPLTIEGVKVDFLTDQMTAKATFAPSLGRLKQQFNSNRPIEARSAPARSLHDRLIAIDELQAFTVTQSFKALASRSAASIVRVEPETAALKVAAYRMLWDAATIV